MPMSSEPMMFATISLITIITAAGSAAECSCTAVASSIDRWPMRWPAPTSRSLTRWSSACSSSVRRRAAASRSVKRATSAWYRLTWSSRRAMRRSVASLVTGVPMGSVPQYAADFGEQHRPVHRLVDVVAAPALEADLDHARLRAGRDHDHGDGLRHLEAAQRAHGFEAGLPRHDDVHEDQIGPARHRDFHRLLAIARGQQLISRAREDHAVQRQRGL